MTNRDFVSQIRSMSKLLSTDSLINDRTILKEGRIIGAKLVKQAMDEKKLLTSPYLFAFIPCFEMEEASLSECCEYTSEVNIARSKKKLPKIGESNWGLAMQVFGLSGKKRFKRTDPNRYANILKLKLTTKDIYYWVQNEYLYTSSEDIKAVNMHIFPTEEIPNDILYPGEDCDCTTDKGDLCTAELDKQFYFPGEKVYDIAEIVYKRLMSIYFAIEDDKTSDNKEDGQRR